MSETFAGERPRAMTNRSATKRAAILEAASAAFLSQGYDGTSMDEIAASARVSKQTMYKHFSDKERLFSAVVTGEVRKAGDIVAAAAANFPDSGDLEADLRALARKQLELVMTPKIMQLRRLVIANADRFPALGRVFFEEGPGRTIAALANLMERLSKRGLLTIDDHETAAAHFNWLVMSTPLNAVMFLGRSATPAKAALNRFADDGVRAFLAAYGSKAAT